MEKVIRRTMAVVATVLVLLIIGVVIEEKSGILREGDKAPDFKVQLSNGQTFRLKDMEGKKNVVLFFYPKDFSAGCTAQACSIRDGFGELANLDADVFGISGDSYISHSLFRKKHNLPFELIADTDGALRKAFGAERFGGLVNIPKRLTYVIDRKGVIRLAAHHEFLMGRHLADVLATMKVL